MKLKLTPNKNIWYKMILPGFIMLPVLINMSCQKFVDVKRTSSQYIIATSADCQLILDNYSYMNTNYSSDGEASADDYYLLNSGYLLNDLKQADRDLYTWAPTAIRPSGQDQWTNPYHSIFANNLVLETLDKLKSGTTDQTTLNTQRGSALFYRAFNFWQLAQLYANSYNAATADQDAGIPLRLSSDINGVSVRGTVAQTYARITQDLQEAVGLLPTTSTIATRPNKASAYAMLARTYLSMEDYPNALINANAALQLNSQLIDFNTLDAGSSTPFTRFNKEVIFHAIMSSDIALNPIYPGSALARIDSVLVKSYQPNDLRKVILLKQNSDGTFRFTGNYEPTTSSTFFDGLAVDELYLIRAESYARAGNITSAMNDLNILLVTRWKKDNGVTTYTNMTASTADEALAKILTERRKELLMRGLRWTDLRRLNRDSRFLKTLSRVAQGVTYTLPPNDLRYTLLIPQQVITNSGIAQNPR